MSDGITICDFQSIVFHPQPRPNSYLKDFWFRKFWNLCYSEECKDLLSWKTLFPIHVGFMLDVYFSISH